MPARGLLMKAHLQVERMCFCITIIRFPTSGDTYVLNPVKQSLLQDRELIMICNVI